MHYLKHFSTLFTANCYCVTAVQISLAASGVSVPIIISARFAGRHCQYGKHYFCGEHLPVHGFCGLHGKAFLYCLIRPLNIKVRRFKGVPRLSCSASHPGTFRFLPFYCSVFTRVERRERNQNSYLAYLCVGVASQSRSTHAVFARSAFAVTRCALGSAVSHCSRFGLEKGGGQSGF